MNFFTIVGNKKDQNGLAKEFWAHEVDNKSYLNLRVAPRDTNSQPGLYSIKIRQSHKAVEPADLTAAWSATPGSVEVKQETPIKLHVWCRVLSLIMDSSESRNNQEVHFV